MRFLNRLRSRFKRKPPLEHKTPATEAPAFSAAAHSVTVYGFPTAETFDETDYLNYNPDVAQAVYVGAFKSGRDHFEQFGHMHTHKIPFRDALPKVAAMRKVKSQRIAEIIKPELRESQGEDGVFDVLTDAVKSTFGVVDTTNVSSNDYDHDAMALITALPDGLLLDCGAGNRSTYYHNVVNYEIAKYPSTDVLSVAEVLPFSDNSFDAVFSYAVLEHVKNPFMAAKEICRVLKPGGTLRAVVPFLQPLHGFPSHYFNMTQFGLKALFENDLEIEAQYVRPEYGPIWTMYTLIRAWHVGLPANLQKPFLDLTLRELLVHPVHSLDKDFVTGLPEAAQFEIASATGLVGINRSSFPPECNLLFTLLCA